MAKSPNQLSASQAVLRMADKRLKDMMDPKTLPFDAKRMIYGGFESLVKA